MAILVTVPGLTNVGALRTSIGNWLHRADYLEYVDDLIAMGEKWIMRNVRIREMEEPLDITIASGVAPMPADYVALRVAYIDGSPIRKLQRKGADWIYDQFRERSSGEDPVYIASDQGEFIFGPYPTDGAVLKGTYYKRLESVLTSDNALIRNHFDLYLWACLAEAAPFVHDDARVAMWTQKRDQAVSDINMETTRERFSGGNLTIQSVI